MESGATAPVQLPATDVEGIPTLEARETSGMTSKLVLSYVEREGGREAVDAVLRRCGLDGREAEMRDENHWFPHAAKIELFEAARDELDDPLVMRHVGESALDLDVGEGLKAALRALGSPALVYRNVVRANAKFNAVHRMRMLEIEPTRARVRYEDVAGVGFHPLDCQYNVGILACVPELFGQRQARVLHPVCGARGDDACEYEVRWDHHVSGGRLALGAGLAGAGAIGAAALLAPALLPAGVAIAAAAAIGAAWRGITVARHRWDLVQQELLDQTRLGERLASSLQDLTGELRLEELLEKITANAQAAVGGKQFALVVEGPEGELSCRAASDVPPAMLRALERWLGETRQSASDPLVIDDISTVPALEMAARDEALPLGSLCAAPLTYGGRTIGSLVALATSSTAFLPRDVDLLSSYAVQAAVALTNARLFEVQERLAARDPLTGLLNRRELDAALRREIQRNRRSGRGGTIVLFDLDGFKLVNDTRGHTEGDRVLRRVGEAISGCCRASDLAFRVGGDEFALLLPDTPDVDAADGTAQRARAAVAALDGRLGTSFGSAAWPADGEDTDALLTAADRRLYEMKGQRSPAWLLEAGRDGHDGGAHERLAVASRLSAKLAPLRGEEEIATTTVNELDASFGYFLAVIHRVDSDGQLRMVAATGPLIDQMAGKGWVQSVHEGVNGRVARTGLPALVPDTRADPDFLGPQTPDSSLSELAVPIRVGGRTWGVLNLESMEAGAFGRDDVLLADTVAAQVGSALQVGDLLQRLENAFDDTLAVLCDALETKDAYTAEHTREVADMAERIGRRIGMAGDQLRALRFAALLHDIGKIGIRSAILNKPGPLTSAERAEMERHTVIGAKMLERVSYLAPSLPLIRSAHERWDGDGYPDGLAAEQIPLGARVICACDAFHAMVSDRPYRPAMSREDALAELSRCSGAQFDARVVDALVAELGDV